MLPENAERQRARGLVGSSQKQWAEVSWQLQLAGLFAYLVLLRRLVGFLQLGYFGKKEPAAGLVFLGGLFVGWGWLFGHFGSRGIIDPECQHGNQAIHKTVGNVDLVIHGISSHLDGIGRFAFGEAVDEEVVFLLDFNAPLWAFADRIGEGVTGTHPGCKA